MNGICINLLMIRPHLKPREAEKKQMGEVFTPPSLRNYGGKVYGLLNPRMMIEILITESILHQKKDNCAY